MGPRLRGDDIVDVARSAQLSACHHRAPVLDLIGDVPVIPID